MKLPPCAIILESRTITAMNPISITSSLPQIQANEESDRVLVYGGGEWHIARLMLLGSAEEPASWSFDNEQIIDLAVTHWMNLPPAPAPV